MKRASEEAGGTACPTPPAARVHAADWRNARRFISYLHVVDSMRIVGSDAVAGGRRVVGGTGVQRLESLFGALGFDDAPAGVVERHGVAREQESVEGPRPLRHIR